MKYAFVIERPLYPLSPYGACFPDKPATWHSLRCDAQKEVDTWNLESNAFDWDTFNPDCATTDELRAWTYYLHHTPEIGLRFCPDDEARGNWFASYLEAYCTITRFAMAARIGGRLQVALAFERGASAIYDELPPELKW